MKMTFMCPDYYWTLGLSRYASEADVRKAYQKLASHWHPSNFPPADRLEAEAKFREISEAFEVLSDKDRRMIYDKHGRQGLLDFEDVGIPINGVCLPSSSPRFGHSAPKRRGLASFRDPNDVFYEVFGSNEPAVVFRGYAAGMTENRFLHDDHRFEHTFPGFSRPATKITLKTPPSPAGIVTWYKGSVFSGPTDEGDYRTVAHSTKIVDGRQIVTKRNVLNAREVVTVHEDGVLVSKTVDGEPRELY